MRKRLVPSLLIVFLLSPLLARGVAPPPPVPVRIPVGPNVVLEIQGTIRRVVVKSSVCMRKGMLEGLVTRAAKGKSKDHEYLLAADVDARHLHAGLLLAGGKKGAPVRYEPRFVPPSGTAVKIRLRYRRNGQIVTVPAGEWFRHARTKKALGMAWVFAGSFEGPNPEKQGGPPFYMANHGAVISVCNVATAVLDLPCRSPKAPNDRHWEANTARIPEIGTLVEVVLEPVLANGASGKLSW